jgi:hypothetical protein
MIMSTLLATLLARTAARCHWTMPLHGVMYDLDGRTSSSGC